MADRFEARLLRAVHRIACSSVLLLARGMNGRKLCSPSTHWRKAPLDGGGCEESGRGKQAPGRITGAYKAVGSCDARSLQTSSYEFFKTKQAKMRSC